MFCARTTLPRFHMRVNVWTGPLMHACVRACDCVHVHACMSVRAWPHDHGAVAAANNGLPPSSTLCGSIAQGMTFYAKPITILADVPKEDMDKQVCVDVGGCEMGVHDVQVLETWVWIGRAEAAKQACV
eukprot:352807-Chlamydomonas_euryale.AAC.8